MKNNKMPYRSLLWTSALNPKRFYHAQKVGAYIGIIDLEDSIRLEEKDEARKIAISFFENKPDHAYGMRINSLRTIHGIRDIESIIDSRAQPDLIILPKVESPEEIIIANQLLSNKDKMIKFGAIIESARGFESIYDIASVNNNLEFLNFGPADLVVDLGVDIDWPGLDYNRALTVMAAIKNGIYAIESNDFDIHDDEKLRSSCIKARKMGFVGKSAIHPNQVSIINETFLPSPAQVDYAKKIVAESQNADSAIFVLEGKIIGPPTVKVAKNILLQSVNHTNNLNNEK